MACPGAPTVGVLRLCPTFGRRVQPIHITFIISRPNFGILMLLNLEVFRRPGAVRSWACA
jgi:hypothetical protein